MLEPSLQTSAAPALTAPTYLTCLRPALAAWDLIRWVLKARVRDRDTITK
jgi:hypothetical protein